MNNRFSDSTEQAEKRKQNANRIVIILIFILIVFDIFSTSNYVDQQTPRQLYAMILSYVATAISFIFAWLIRKNRVTIAVWGLIVLNILCLFLSPFLGTGLGIPYGLTSIAFTLVISGQCLPRRQIAFANLLGLVSGIGIYVLDISLPPELVPSMSLSSNIYITTIILVGLILVLMFVVARQFKDYTIRTKLIILFLAASIIPLSILTSLNYINSRNALIDNANSVLGASATITASQLDRYFIQGMGVVGSEAQLPDVVDYLSLPDGARAGSDTEKRAQKFIYALARQDVLYTESISIIDLQGRILADSTPFDVGTSKSDTDYFQKVIKTGLPYATPIKFDQQTGLASIYFAAPVRDATGRIIGALSKQYQAARLQADISKNTNLAGTDSFAILLDQNHLRLADGSDESLVYKTLVPLTAKKMEDLQAAELLPPGTRSKLSTSQADFVAYLNNVQNQPYFATELHLDHIDVEQVATAKMATQPWTVAFAQPQKVFLEPINGQTRNNVLISILISLLVAGLGFVVSQTIAGPIIRLTKTARSVIEGDLFISASVETRDEIGDLASSFNTMTVQLRSLIDSLEERIADRTAVAESARAEAEASAAEAQSARKDLEAQIWLVTGQTQLAAAIRSEPNLSKLANNIIRQVSQYVGAQAGVLYLLEKETLKQTGSYSFRARPGFEGTFQLGQGLVGQVAADNRSIVLTRPENATIISTGLVDFAPRQVLLTPFDENGQVAGVLELATLTAFTKRHEDFLAHVSESIGIAVRTAQARQRLADVLLETQQQAEELQAQEEELRAANEELQAQAENLRSVRGEKAQKDEA